MPPGKKITPFGRRVLVRHALLTQDGNTGVPEIAKQLGIFHNTLWKMMRNTEPEWWMQPEFIEPSARLCRLLKVDHSWLFDTTHYGDFGSLQFDLARRSTWGS